MSNFDQATRTAEKSMRSAQDMAQEQWSQVERGVASTMANVRDYQLKTMGLIRSQADSSFDLAEELLSARSPDQVMGAWKSFADRQVDMINRHASEFSAMAQTVAKENVQPFKDAAKRA
jgi:hypothetical protein